MNLQDKKTRNMNSDKEVELILNESEKICERLNKALIEGGKSINVSLSFYAVARFTAQYLYDISPILENDPVETFTNTVKNIMQAFEDEGPDKTHRLLKYRMEGEGETEIVKEDN